MFLYPAIDIRGGRTVRLVRGDYERETAFDVEPAAAAQRWAAEGADALHVVDLDGAREGAPVNLEHLLAICAAVTIPVQVGGGLRESGDVAAVLDAGAERAVLGTAALTDPALIESLAAEYGERIVVAADTRGGRVAIEGWQRESAISAAELVAGLAGRGVRRFLYTPVEVDGTLAGPGLEGVREVATAAANAHATLVYSGGIGELEHLRELAAAGLPALEAVIVGRALYEHRFTVAEAKTALQTGSSFT